MKITTIAIRQKVFMTRKVGSRNRARFPASSTAWMASRLIISCALSSRTCRSTPMEENAM